LIVAAVFLVSGLIGCAGSPQALQDADAAIAAARQAGKDQECPNEFNAAAKRNAHAHEICGFCNQKEAIAEANEAIRMTNALCPKRVAAEPAPAPRPTPPPAAPGVSSSVVDRLTLHVRFDFNKSTLKNPNDPDLQKAVEFVKKYPGSRVSVEGYTDDVGTDPYNQGLSERRAATVKNYLAQHGADASKIQSSGKGKSNPVADNATDEGRAQNRRVEVLILAE
jgi:outer membrane protein OmpA-like peptidoglycan-associated protein